MLVKKIPSDELEIGMNVSSLDRPWSETPFLFAGFKIHKTSELNDLQKYCKYVYVLTSHEEIEIHSLYGDNETPDYCKFAGKAEYTISRSVEDEISIIEKDHEKIVELITDIEIISEKNGELDFDEINNSIQILVQSITRNPDAFIWLTEIKIFDSYVYKDALSCAIWATILGRELGFAENHLQSLAMGALLMDIGKTALPKTLIHKSTKLSHDDWELMKTHVDHSLSIIKTMPNIPVEVIELVMFHHERIDGSGYPDGLMGSQIPLFSQIAGVVDFYVSVTNSRPFAPAISPSTAIEMLYHQQNKFFDETIIEAFIKALGTYPTGSLVELSTGDTGIVIAQNEAHKLRPQISLLLNAKRQPYQSKIKINLLNETKDGNGHPLFVVKTLSDGAHGLKVKNLSI